MFLPLSNGIEWAVGYGEVQLGDAVLIQGPGQQGLACAFAAKQAGAGCVIVSGLARDTYRLEIASKLGADHVINVEDEDLVSRVRDYTGGDGVNVVVNVTGGGKGTVAESIQVAAKRCNVVLAAPGSEMIDVASFGRRKLNLKQANGHSYRSVERAIEYLADGVLPMEDIATHTFDLNHAREAIETLAGLRGPAVHVSIVPGN